MEYKVKKLYFGDIRKVAQTINDLDLSSEQVKKLYDLFGEVQQQIAFPSIEAADAYLKQNTTKEEYNVLKTKTAEERSMYATQVRFEKTNFIDKLIEQSMFLVGLLATKFDVIVDFMNYFIENVSKEQILQFEGDDTKKAIVAIFSNAGFLQYFKSMFS